MDELSLFDTLITPPRIAEAERILARIAAGSTGDEVESETVEVKADPVVMARTFPRGGGQGDPADERNRIVAYACACLANHEGGLFLLGVSDDLAGADALLGTDADPEALRLRISQLTHPHLVVTPQVITKDGVRVIAIAVPRNETKEPHGVTMSASGGKRHPRRISSTCEDMAGLADMLAWSNARSEHDWSSIPTGRPIGDARPGALDVARGYLRGSGEPDRVALADADDSTLIMRLGLASDGHLNNAGVMLLCSPEWPTLDYGYRTGGGVAASRRIVNDGARSLLENLNLVDEAIGAQNRMITLPASGSLAIGSVRALPPDAIREALVNAVMHRDWTIHEPVVIDHQADQMVITSPGGLVAGLTVDRLISSPSRPRNRVLANALRSMRLAEGEGTGIDKMFISMITLGHSPPVVEERDGGIRVTLVGGEPVPAVMRAYQAMPAWMHGSARTALAIHLLRSQPSFTVRNLDSVLHEGEPALRPFLDRACDEDVLRRTANPRPGGEAAWRLSDAVREALGSILPYYARPTEESIQLVAQLAQEQGSVRNRDVQDLLGVTAPRASQILQRAVSEGLIKLEPGAKPLGRSTRYIPT